MDQQQAQASKEAVWRDRLARHALSRKSIAAFCRDEVLTIAQN